MATLPPLAEASGGGKPGRGFFDATAGHKFAQVASAVPFDEWDIALDDQIHRYLQVYLSVAHDILIVHGGLVESSRNSRFLNSAASMIRGCLQYELLLYAVLANMSTMLPEVELHSCLSTSSYYCYRATKAVRLHLLHSPQPDEVILIGLWHLISAEQNRGNLDAAITHLEGANAMLRCIQKSEAPASSQYFALVRACKALVPNGPLD